MKSFKFIRGRKVQPFLRLNAQERAEFTPPLLKLNGQKGAGFTPLEYDSHSNYEIGNMWGYL